MAALAPEPVGSDNSITALLLQLSAGNREVEAILIPQVYGELRRLAAHYMRAERGNHTLQPIALVNEAYARLVQQPEVPWQSRAHFFATASQLMRHILVDHARKRQAGKRGGIQRHVTLNESVLQAENRTIDVLILHEALERLAQLDPPQPSSSSTTSSADSTLKKLPRSSASPTAPSSAAGAWPEHG